jgi:hypothetical protein
VRQRAGLVERSADVARQLLQPRSDRTRICVERLLRQRNGCGGPDEVLLQAIVKITLDRAAVGVRVANKPCPGRT